MGFGVPIDRWFRGELKDELRAVLLDPVALGRGLFRPEAVAALVDEHVDGRRDHALPALGPADARALVPQAYGYVQDLIRLARCDRRAPIERNGPGVARASAVGWESLAPRSTGSAGPCPTVRL